MWKEIRRNYRRAVATVLTAVMTFTNVFTGVPVAFAAGEKEESLFLVEGSALREAIEDAKESGEVFDLSSLEMQAGRKSVKNKYEELLGSKKGDVYELDVEVDDSYALPNTGVAVFYNEGTDKVIFLFANGSDMVVDFIANVDGYATEPVTVQPNTNNVENDGEEELDYTVNYEAGDMVDDTSVRVNAELIPNMGVGGTVDTEEGEGIVEGAEEKNGEESEVPGEEDGEKEEESKDAAGENQTEDPTEDPAGDEAEKNDSAEDSNGNGAIQAEDPTENPADNESNDGTADSEEAGNHGRDAANVEDNGENAGDAGEDNGPELSLSNHAVAIVATTPMLPGGENSFFMKKPGNNSETEATEGTEPEDKTQKADDGTGAPKSELPTEGSKDSESTEPPKPSAPVETPDGTEPGTSETPEVDEPVVDPEPSDPAVTPEGTEPGTPAETPEAPETGEPAEGPETVDPAGTPEISNGTETIPSNGQPSQTVEDVVATSSNASGTLFDKIKLDDDQEMVDDDYQVLGELEGKAYDTVTVLGTLNVAAFVVDVDDLPNEDATDGWRQVLICNEDHEHTDECYIWANVTIYSDEPYNDVMNLSMKAGDEWTDFGSSHLESMKEEPPFGVNVTLPTDGEWKSLNEEVISLTPDGGMTVNVDDGACQILYIYTDEDGASSVAMWDVTVGVGIETMSSYGSFKDGLEEVFFGSNGHKIMSLMGVDGHIAYCIQHGVDLVSSKDKRNARQEKGGSKYTELTAEQLALIRLVIQQGYNGSFDAENWYYVSCQPSVREAAATQLLIWDIIDGKRSLSNFGDAGYTNIAPNVNRNHGSKDWVCTHDTYYNTYHDKNKGPKHYHSNKDEGTDYWFKTSAKYGAYDVGSAVLDEYASLVTSVKGEIENQNKVLSVSATRTDTGEWTKNSNGTYTKTISLTLTGDIGDNWTPSTTDVRISALQKVGTNGISCMVTLDSAPTGNETFSITINRPPILKKGNTEALIIWYDSTYQNLLWADGNDYDLGKTGNISFTVASSEFGPAPVDVPLSIKKEITTNNNDTELKPTFTFDVTFPDDAPSPERTTGTVTGEGTIDFGNIHFDKEGVYTYTIKESEDGKPNGFTYAGSKTVTFVVEKNTNNELKVTKTTWSGGTNIFENTYRVTSTSWTPGVEKTINASEGADCSEDEFKFQLALTGATKSGGITVNEEAKNAESVIGEVTVKGSKKDNANKATFPKITFTKEGTYTFVISEVDPPKGYTKNTQDQTIDVTVTADENGNLVAAGENYKASYEFVNTYDYGSVIYKPEVSKTVETDHDRPVEKIFTFVLKDESEGDKVLTEDVKARVTIPKGNEKQTYKGQFEFSNEEKALKFTKPGTYKFTISEEDEASDNPGYEYSDQQYTITVLVEDDHSQGKLKSTVTVKDGKGATVEMEGSTFDFINKYTPIPTDTQLKVSKKITGEPRPFDGTKLFYNFTFNLEPKEDYGDTVELPADRTVKIQIPVQDEGKFTKAFDKIIFNKAGTYNFEITEERVFSDDNYIPITYDSRIWTVVVEVEDNDGELHVKSTTYTDGTVETNGPAEFVNDYNPKEIGYGPVVRKVIAGSKTPENKQTFTFELTPDKGNKEGGAELPAETVITIEDDGTANFSKNFGNITFKKAGDYTFYIEEKEPDTIPNGYTYDKGQWTLKINVINVKDALVIDNVTYTRDSVTSKSEATFTNRYHVTPVSATQSVHKLITGDKTPNDKMFTFTRNLVKAPEFGEYDFNNGRLSVGSIPLFNLSGDDGVTANPLPADQNTITITGAGTASFPEYTFTAAGTYVFEIREVDTKEPGYQYDPFIRIVTYEIVDKDGVLTIEEGYPKYDRRVEEGTQIEVDSGMLPNIGVETVPGGGEIKVGEDGIQPIALGLPVIGIDSEILGSTNETVEASDPGTLTFTNIYTVTPTELALGIFKKIDGDTPSDKSYDFQFSLEDGNDDTKNEIAAGNVVMPEADTITVTVGGTGSGEGYFDDIVFHKAGTYWFRIAEVAGDTPGFDYDTSVYDVEVTVEDKDSELTVTGGSVHDADGELITDQLDELIDDTASLSTRFTNTYTTTPTSFAPAVRKTVEGQPEEDETFTFRISTAGEYEDQVEMPETNMVTVTGAGEASFGKITFNHAGTFDFTILEEAGKNPYYTYDESEWTLRVEIVDEDSKLRVKDNQVVYSKTGEVSMDAAIFNNIYTVPGDLVLSKTVTGNRGETDRDFSFTVTLTDADGNPLIGTYNYTGSSIEGVEAPADGTVVNGKLDVKLRHGQEITIHDVPAGTKYTVEEAEADTEGYQTSVQINEVADNDNVAEGTITTSDTWIVEFENYRNRGGGGGGTTPGGNPGGNPGGGPGETTTINDAGVPLASLPNDTVTLEDEDVPLAALLPQTRDNRNLATWLMLFSMAGIGMLGAAIGLKKSKEEEE